MLDVKGDVILMYSVMFICFRFTISGSASNLITKFLIRLEDCNNGSNYRSVVSALSDSPLVVE